MKLLAVSDIHGNVEAVKMLRERERNQFDAVVVAGDIGSKAATEIMAILATFACPVMYVLGNWDRDVPYDLNFGPTCHHLHLSSIECGGWAFAGFSGLPAGWGKNPIAAALRQEVENKHAFASPDKADYLNDLRSASNEAQRLNRQELAAVINGSRAGPSRTIVVTHERLFRVESRLGWRSHFPVWPSTWVPVENVQRRKVCKRLGIGQSSDCPPCNQSALHLEGPAQHQRRQLHDHRDRR